MYHFSDSDSVDSDEGIRYKTESIRNKKSADKNEREKESYTHRERKRSLSRSRSRHHMERKKLKSRKRDRSPEEKSNKKTSRSKCRDSDRSKKYRKEKSKSKKEDSNNHKNEMGEKINNECSDTVVVSDESSKYGPSLPKKENTSNPKLELDFQINEKCRNDPSQPTKDNIENPAFGPTLPPKGDIPTKSESRLGEQTQNGNTFGPQLPPHLVKKAGEENSIIGPVLPLHFITVSSLDDDSSSDLNSSNTQENKESSSGNNLIGPALPPHLMQKNEEKVGPSLPPHVQQEENISCAERDEDVYGPVPAGAHYSQAHIELEERALKIKMDQLDPKENNQPVREEWMLTLPEAKAAKFGLGSRQFRSKAGPDLSDRSSWTDTPEDKAKKKEGKVEPAVDLKREAELKQIQSKNLEQEGIAKKHKKEKESLLEIHRKKLKEKKNESGPSERRPFSREIDLQVNRFDEAQKQAVLKKAQLLDNRFLSGESKFL